MKYIHILTPYISYMYILTPYISYRPLLFIVTNVLSVKI